MSGANLSMGGYHVPDAPPVTDQQRRAASVTLAAHARDADELRCWLDMLGLP